MSLILSDLRYAVRLLVTRPGFALSTMLMLAGGLGIGLYTFAVLETMFYGDVPLPDGSSIVKLGAGSWVDIEPLDAFELATIRASAESLDELGVFRASRSRVGVLGMSRGLRSVESDWRIFEFTRTPPQLGRGFVSDDNAAAAEPVAVLSHETWQSMFAGNADVVGELVRIDDRLTRIVGVMPEGYAFPESAEIWLPLGPADLAPIGYTDRGLETYARLRPDVSAAAAETELTALLQRVRRERPIDDEQTPDTVAVLRYTEGGMLGTVFFGILNLLSMSILLLAAVNVGNLLLARTNERIKEVGVRIALGAPRLQLIVQTMLENVLLCVIGGGVALFLVMLALKATNGFVRASYDGMPFWWAWSLDRDVVVAAGVFLLLTVVAVSVMPALRVIGVDPNALLRDGTRTGGVGAGRTSRRLVTVQIALISAVIVVGGAVAVVAHRAATFDDGLDTDGIFTMRVELPEERYATSSQRLSLYESLLAELRGAAGIEAATIMQSPGVTRFAVDSDGYATPAAYPAAWHVVLSETPTPLGPILVEGRAFDGSDSATGPKTAIVSASLAKAQWPGESAIGRRIDVRLGDREAERRTIVGIVGDVGYDPLGTSPMGVSAIYVPLPQFTGASTRILVRSLAGESGARNAMFEALTRVDPGITPEIDRYDEGQERVTLVASIVTKLFVGCGLFAVFLAVSGIYGMSRNAVVLRRREIGLRRALGANNANVIATFVRQGTRQLAVGLGVSALLSALVLLVLRQGFAVEAGTLVLLAAAVVAVVSGCVLLSIYLAVRDISRLEPSAALRFD